MKKFVSAILAGAAALGFASAATINPSNDGGQKIVYSLDNGNYLVLFGIQGLTQTDLDDGTVFDLDDIRGFVTGGGADRIVNIYGGLGFTGTGADLDGDPQGPEELLDAAGGSVDAGELLNDGFSVESFSERMSGGFYDGRVFDSLFLEISGTAALVFENTNTLGAGFNSVARVLNFDIDSDITGEVPLPGAALLFAPIAGLIAARRRKA